MLNRDKYLYSKTVKGHAYTYLRAPGGKLVRLPDRTAPEFNAAYDAALRTVETAPAPAPVVARVIPQSNATFAVAVDAYLGSLDFQQVKPKTQKRYADACAILRDQLGSGPLADLKISHVEVYSERVAVERGTAVADLHTSLIKLIWESCRKHAQFGIADLANPAQHAKKHYKVQSEHMEWSDAEIEAFLKVAPAHMRLALMLCWQTGQRGGDIVKMRWSDFDGSIIKVRIEKTSTDHECFCTDQLIEALKVAPRRGEFILTMPNGRPFATANLLGKAFHRELVKAGVTGRSMHGLRKRAACDAAEIGGVEAAMAVGGWKNQRVAAYYAKRASKRRLGAEIAAKRSSNWQPAVIAGGKAA